nr:hypothetical protein LTR18_007154 [Exophiala xenobiotica]
MEDYDPIRGQHFQFHKDVLKNKILEEYASKSLAILAQVLGDPNIGWEVADLMRRIVRLTRQVPTQLVKCASLGLLDKPTRLVIWQRWVRLEKMSELMCEKGLLTELEQVVPGTPSQPKLTGVSLL